MRAIDCQNFSAVRVEQWWTTGSDVLLTPMEFGLPAMLADLTPAARRAVETMRKIGPHLFFMSPFNVMGQPAISLPPHRLLKRFRWWFSLLHDGPRRSSESARETAGARA